MYIPECHKQDSIDGIVNVIESYPLGGWVLFDGGELISNHIPFYFDRNKGPFGTLIGHVSRSNDVWKKLEQNSPSIVIFQGPQIYITPNWYPGKKDHGKVVPTWNYHVVHAHGVARAIEDREWILDMLNKLTIQFEASQKNPWRVEDAPSDFIQKLMGAIIGIEIPIERLEGKLKASQDEDMLDRKGTVIGLRNSSCSQSIAMADLVDRAI